MHVIDEMPTLGEVEQAEAKQVVAWQLYLRPTMLQGELDVVKAIARRYEAMPPSLRERYQHELRRQHG